MCNIFKRPCVSVIVPNYNNGKWISDCFDSIINQTYKNIEIVIIDDFSTDNSRDIIRCYERRHPNKFSAIYLNKNGGVAQARHIGIVNSKGNFITTLDADDYYSDERKLGKEIELVQKYKRKYNKDIIAFSNIVHEFENGDKTIQGDCNNIVQGTVINQIMGRKCMIPRDLTFLKSLYFYVGRYNSSLEPHEDWDLKIRLADKYEYYYTGISGTVYRIHNSGLSSIAHELRTKTLKRVFNKNIHLINNYTIKRKVKNDFWTFMKKRDRSYFNKLRTSHNKIKPSNLYAIPYAFDYYLKVFSAFGPKGIRYLLEN